MKEKTVTVKWLFDSAGSYRRLRRKIESLSPEMCREYQIRFARIVFKYNPTRIVLKHSIQSKMDMKLMKLEQELENERKTI